MTFLGNIFKTISLILYLIAIPSTASAEGISTQVGNIFVDYSGNGVAAFTITGTNPSWASCATTKRFAINLGNGGGQAIFAQLLNAKLNGKTFTVSGTGACDVWSDSETVQYIQF